MRTRTMILQYSSLYIFSALLFCMHMPVCLRPGTLTFYLHFSCIVSIYAWQDCSALDMHAGTSQLDLV